MNSVIAIFLFTLCLLVNVISESSSTTALSCNRETLPDISQRELLATNFNMLMSESEKVLFLRELLKVENYFEFGAGGSTQIACQLTSLLHVTSIDNNYPFLIYLTNSNQTTSSCIADSIVSNRLALQYVNTGEVGDFGIPSEPFNRSLWSAYPSAILDIPGPRPQLVLVDGRFRVACALHALLVVGYEGRILFHDFFERPHYHKILDHTDVLDCVGSLIVLKRKATVDWAKVFEDIQEYMYDFR